MGKRKFIDWDSIEPLYRAGALSLNEICAQYEADHVHSQKWKTTVTHAAILKQAKKKNWTRSLADKVQKRIKEKLVTSSVTSCNQGEKVSDEEYVEQAAEVGTNIVLRHQREAAALLEHEDRLLEELVDAKKLYITQYKGKTVEKTVDMTAYEKAQTLKALTEVRAKRIALERQAHNIDDNPGSSNGRSHEDWLTELGA